jgi:hypothetical protein
MTTLHPDQPGGITIAQMALFPELEKPLDLEVYRSLPSFGQTELVKIVLYHKAPTGVSPGGRMADERAPALQATMKEDISGCQAL